MDVYNKRVEPILVSLSDSYSKDNSISVHDSRPSSSPAYTATDYLSLLITDLRKDVCDVVLRRMFYSKRCFKNDRYSYM